ncbi:DUF3108 domain-containing protein [Nisaea acidiphila]|uniref:DUF3108 domain-containing protein n=1 Tax=Nisaea acidiphila TaxID=1862145 RepID=A0A9J7AYF0_9PROT|nr:DUF3108 domain-containing protein [Nisaea acidiphila]UUX51818.1 DUF3108 domain-containing protein [Nisaea acidiphila]
MRWLIAGLVGAVVLAGKSDARELDLSYAIYFGGFSVAEFDSKIEYSAADYRVTTSARSTGILDYFFPIEVMSEGRGVLAEGRVRPRMFRSTGTFDGEPRRTSLKSRIGAAPEVSVHPPRDPEKRDAVPEALQLDTIDPYAAVVALALKSDGHPCESELPVFNGRTRTDFRLSPAGSDRLPKTDYSAFSGPADICEVTYETLAGGYKKPWFGKDKTGARTRLWVSRLTEDGPWVPVRLESEGLFGMVVGHITGASERIDLAERTLLKP